MKTKAIAHVYRYQEAYLHLPGVIGFLVALAFLFRALTGRADREDLGGIVGLGVQALTLVIASAFTMLAKRRLFSPLTDDETRTLPRWRVLLDSCETIALFLSALWALVH